MAQNPEFDRHPNFIDHVPSAQELAPAALTPAGELGLTDGQFKVSRSNGQIETGWSVGYTHVGSGNVPYATIGRPDESDPSLYLTRVVRVDKLLGWQHPQPERSLDESAPEQHNPMAARAAEIMSQLDAIKAHFGDEQDRNLWSYAAGTMNKAEAQRRGDGHGSTLEGQNAGQAFRGLSPEARAVAPEYLRLMQQLEQVRAQL